MLRRSRLVLLLICTSLAALAQTQNAQDNPASIPTLKAKVREVLVDVVVTDSKGSPVPALKEEEFQVLEDGKPQKISHFEEHKGAQPTQFKLPPMPPNVYTNFPVTQSADSINVILLDALNTPLPDQSYVHVQMLKYLQTIPPNTRVAIFALASRLRMLQGITTDSSQMLAAVKNAKAFPQSSALLPSNAESDAYQSRNDFLRAESMAPAPSPGQIPVQYSADPVSASQQFLADTAHYVTEMRVSMTLEALQQLGRYLYGIPGRKNVIWFSGSFPAAFVPNNDLPDPFSQAREFHEEIRKTTDILAAAQVALYPIAAEGLVTDNTFQADAREIGTKRISAAAQDVMQQSRIAAMDLGSRHDSMEQLAKDTGGRAFYNTNGLSDALGRVVNDGSRYYSLAYSPSNAKMDGTYRRIQVKLATAKGALAYRRGYYADDVSAALAPSQKQASDPLLPLMGRNLPDYDQILYKILAQPLNPQPAPDAPRAGTNSEMKGPFTRYAVDFAVTPGDLRLEQSSDAVRHGEIEVMLVAYDSEGKPLNLVVTRSEIRITAEDYPKLLKGGLSIHKEIDIPKVEAFLRTGIYDLKSHNAGTLGVPLGTVASPSSR